MTSFWKRFIAVLLWIFRSESEPDEEPIPDLPVDPVRINYFKVSPHEILSGQKVELSWATEGASTVRIRPLGLQELSGRIFHEPKSPSFTYILVAEGPKERKTRTKTVFVKQDLIRWENIEREKFRRAVSLHLGNTDTVDALQSIDSTLIWDGIRNPDTALGCNKKWTEYNGFSREQVKDIIRASDKALLLLRKYADIRTGADGINRIVVGLFKKGPVDRREWEAAITSIVDATLDAAELNGIRGLCK